MHQIQKLLKSARFISMLLFIYTLLDFSDISAVSLSVFYFSHLASVYPYTRRPRVKFQKPTIFFSVFSFCSMSSPPPAPFFHSPRLPNSVNTWWILRYFFFTCTGRFSVIADSFESRSFGEVQLPTSFVLSQDRLVPNSRNRENPLVSRRYVGQ